MSSTMALSIVRGGPFDGSPTFLLRFEQDAGTFDPGKVLYSLNSMEPPPIHFTCIYAVGQDDETLPDGIAKILRQVKAWGMSSMVDIYGPWEPWMLLFDWRRFHTTDLLVPYPVEEVVFHTEENDPPQVKLYPFHEKARPVLWWAPDRVTESSLSLLPHGMKLWLARKVPEVSLEGGKE